MITEDYVSFEVAKLLKEKGFNELCFALYNPNEELIQCGIRLNNTQVGRVEGSYSAPTIQIALKWLRKVHNIFIQIDYVVLAKNFFEYSYELHDMSKGRSIAVSAFRDDYETYEEACEAAIKYCLTNLIYIK